ncbi:MAG: hypothetical protein ACRDRN_10400 [Sciscionella sp.]
MGQLSDETIAEVRRLAEGGVARNEIARRLRVSPGAVTKYAPAGAFERSATVAAVRAHVVDMAERRALLAQGLLGDAERLREQMWEPTKVFAFGGKDNVYNEHPVQEPPVESKRALMQAVSTATSAHLRLVDHDSDGGLDEARSVLDGFMDAVARRANELGADDA